MEFKGPICPYDEIPTNPKLNWDRQKELNLIFKEHLRAKVDTNMLEHYHKEVKEEEAPNHYFSS